mmetsp:Transcript_16125/g.33382  ORF Transcript_16125/g.33382 Transcript_16125/m.33382 type:complete len:259 (+) Transcript_16125:317-1093(+)
MQIYHYLFLFSKSSMVVHLFGTNHGQEHVESNLDGVDEDETMLGGDELEVDGMDQDPDLPRSLAGGEEIVLDLVSDGTHGVSVDQSQVGEEDSHKDGAPNGLVNGDLGGNNLSSGSGDLLIQPVVEEMSRRTVPDETKEGERRESLPVNGSSNNEELCQQISKGPSDERSHGLGDDRLLVQSIIVGSPSRDSTSSDRSRVTEKGAIDGLLVEGRRLDQSTLSGKRRIRAHTKGLSSKGKGKDQDGNQLHFFFFFWWGK